MKYIFPISLGVVLVACGGISFGQSAFPTSPTPLPNNNEKLFPNPTLTFIPDRSSNVSAGGAIQRGTSSEKTLKPTPGEKVKLEDWVIAGSSGAQQVEESKAQPGGWLSLISIGAGVPLSPKIQEAYSAPFHLGLGLGWRASNHFSIWLDFTLDQFNNKNSQLTNDNNYMLIVFAGLVRYRLLRSPFSPFLFLGPGLAYNEDRSTIPQVDTTLGIVTVPITSSEVDFLLEGGAGVSFEALNGLEIFIQGRGVWDTASSQFAKTAYTDSPVILLPLEAGVVLCY